MSVNSCPHFADVFARLKGLGVVSPLGNGYSVFKVRVKEFKKPLTCLNWESKKSGLFLKIIFIPLLIWTKGVEMHTHFRRFERIFFVKFFLPGNLSLHLFGIESRFDTLFQINFLKKI